MRTQFSFLAQAETPSCSRLSHGWRHLNAPPLPVALHTVFLPLPEQGFLSLSLSGQTGLQTKPLGFSARETGLHFSVPAQGDWSVIGSRAHTFKHNRLWLWSEAHLPFQPSSFVWRLAQGFLSAGQGS